MRFVSVRPLCSTNVCNGPRSQQRNKTRSLFCAFHRIASNKSSLSILFSSNSQWPLDPVVAPDHAEWMEPLPVEGSSEITRRLAHCQKGHWMPLASRQKTLQPIAPPPNSTGYIAASTALKTTAADVYTGLYLHYKANYLWIIPIRVNDSSMIKLRTADPPRSWVIKFSKIISTWLISAEFRSPDYHQLPRFRDL